MGVRQKISEFPQGMRKTIKVSYFLFLNPQVKIIILDSIAFHFRHDFEDMALRTRLLHGLVQTFMKMACEHRLAVSFRLFL